MPRLKYDYEMLMNICEEGNVTLLEDYKDKFITRDTRIIGKCISCDNSFNKSLNNLHKQRNFGCEKCAKIIGFDRIKNTMVEKYGVEYAAQSQIFRDKMKDSNIQKYGVEHAMKSEEIKNKVKQTNLETYGVEYGLQNEKVKEKRINTNIEKYGVKYQLQRQEIKDQIKQTNMEKFGVEYVSQSIAIKDKCKNTNMERYGVEHFTQTDIMKEKTIQTNMERYGVEYNLQREEIKEKSKQTNLQRYGVEYPKQNADVMEKITKSSYRLKEYSYPSGNIVKIQGYEHYALDKLLQEGVLEEEIITGCKNVPTIWYNDLTNKKHRYFVDIFIPSQNRCIEIKSTWTAKVNNHSIFLKQKAGKEMGYLYEIWVYDSKGNIVEFYD